MKLPLPAKLEKGFDADGWRTAYAVKQSGDWQHMMDEILACEDEGQIKLCRWRWSIRAIDNLWSPGFMRMAEREFDLAEEFIREWTSKRNETDASPEE